MRRSGSTARQSASMGQPAERFRAGTDGFTVITKVRENTAGKHSPSETQVWKIHFSVSEEIYGPHDRRPTSRFISTESRALPRPPSAPKLLDALEDFAVLLMLSLLEREWHSEEMGALVTQCNAQVNPNSIA